MTTTSKTDAAMGTIFDFQEGEFAAKKFLFVLTDANVTSSYVDKISKKSVKIFPNSVAHKLEVNVYDPKKKRKRIMRLITGESSVWLDEQTPDKDAPNRAIEYANFINGIKLVEGTDTQLLEFLMNDDYNESKPNRDTKVNAMYKLVEVGSELAKEIKREMRLTELKTWCFTGKYAEVKAYARALNVNVNRDPDEVRFRMKQLAEADPTKFIAGMNNAMVLKKHYVLEAIDNSIIRKDDNLNALIWEKENSILIQAPMGRDPVDFFVDNTTTPNGEEAYKTLLQAIKRELASEQEEDEKKEKNPAAPVKTNNTLQTSGLTSDEATKYLDAVKEAGVIEQYGRSAWAFDKGGKQQRKFVGRKAVELALKEEPAFLKKVQDKMLALK